MTQPAYTGTTPTYGPNGNDYYAPDFAGSRQDWVDTVARSLAERWILGLGGLPGYGDASIGQPSQADFNNGGTSITEQTKAYFRKYAEKFGANDPWIISQFGPPPDRSATYQPNPNSASSVQGTFAERSAFDASEAEKDRAVEREGLATQERIAAMQDAGATERTRMQEAGATERVQAQIEASWREATLADATRRYIAEGDWGVQKWVTTENNLAAMERLQLQLGFDREVLAQQAVAEKNRNQEAMLGLALEVAKYDSELAASPRNWLKYAGWLQKRNIIVNGMSLAMAAQEVPEDEIDPATVADATGSNIAAMQADQERSAVVAGTSGGSTSAQDAFTGTQPMAGTTGTQAQVQQQGATPGAEELGQMDPAALANRLLGSNPWAADGGDAAQENLQNIANSLTTANRPRIASFGAYGGSTTNAQGINIPEASGQQVDYRQFSRLLPSEQEAKIGAVESVRGSSGVSDFIKEMESSRPKGGNSRLATFG